MKYQTFFTIVFAIISCSHKQSEISQKSSSKELEFPESYNKWESCTDHIIPDSTYQYWGFIKYESHSKDRIKILKENGIKIQKDIDEEVFSSIGFQFGFECPQCPKYFIITIKNNQTKVLKNFEEMRQFIGRINNIEEAILYAYSYHFRPASEFNYDQKTDKFNYIASNENKVRYTETEDSFSFNVDADNFKFDEGLYNLTVNKNGFIKLRLILKTRKM